MNVDGQDDDEDGIAARRSRRRDPQRLVPKYMMMMVSNHLGEGLGCGIRSTRHDETERDPRSLGRVLRWMRIRNDSL